MTYLADLDPVEHRLENGCLIHDAAVTFSNLVAILIPRLRRARQRPFRRIRSGVVVKLPRDSTSGHKVVIAPDRQYEALCCGVGPNDLTSQFVVGDKAQARQHCVVDRKWVFRNGEYGQYGRAGFGCVNVWCDAELDLVKMALHICPEALQDRSSLRSLTFLVPTSLRLGLVPRDPHCGQDREDRTNCLNPRGPRRCIHLCPAVKFDHLRKAPMNFGGDAKRKEKPAESHDCFQNIPHLVSFGNPTMITRSPSRCLRCGQHLGQEHARGCTYARFTASLIPQLQAQPAPNKE